MLHTEDTLTSTEWYFPGAEIRNRNAVFSTKTWMNRLEIITNDDHPIKMKDYTGSFNEKQA